MPVILYQSPKSKDGAFLLHAWDFLLHKICAWIMLLVIRALLLAIATWLINHFLFLFYIILIKIDFILGSKKKSFIIQCVLIFKFNTLNVVVVILWFPALPALQRSVVVDWLCLYLIWPKYQKIITMLRKCRHFPFVLCA